MNSQSIVDIEKQKKKIIKPVYIATGIVGTILCIQSVMMYSSISKYSSIIYPKVWVEDINLGGKTKEEAKEAIVEKHNNLVAEKVLTIKVNDKQYSVDTSKLNMNYDYNEAVDKAYDVSRNDNLFKKYFYIESSEQKTFQLNHTYNYDVVDSVIKNIEQENNVQAVNAAISKNSSGGFTISKEKYGYAINSEKLKEDIKNKIDNIEKEENFLVQAEIQKIDPKIKEENLKSINAKVSTFTTDFKTSNDNRTINVSLASNAINGKILMPGDTFSFNDVVGERSAERGYKTATVIIDNKFVDDLGGGVCQVSTTLYNAVLRANIPSVERIHHSLPSTYVGLGLDATVAYGLLDYKFKNTLSYPIYIESVIENKNITFNIYSNSTLNSKTYDIVNEVVGDKSKVFKITYENGNQVSKNLLYTDKIELPPVK